MGFGTGILLLTAGAILAFAIKADVWWVDVEAVGVVFMLSGFVVLVHAAWEAERQRPRWATTVNPNTIVVPTLPPPAEPPPLQPAVPAERTVDASRARVPAGVAASAPVTRPPAPTPTPPTPEQPPMTVPPAD
jgi:hypothetical protein